MSPSSILIPVSRFYSILTRRVVLRISTIIMNSRDEREQPCLTDPMMEKLAVRLPLMSIIELSGDVVALTNITRSWPTPRRSRILNKNDHSSLLKVLNTLSFKSKKSWSSAIALCNSSLIRRTMWWIDLPRRNALYVCPMNFCKIGDRRNWKAFAKKYIMYLVM